MWQGFYMKLCFCDGAVSIPGEHPENGYAPRSSKSPSIVTRSAAERRSSESIKQHRSMSVHENKQLLKLLIAVRHFTRVPECKSVPSTSERQQSTIGFDGTNKPLQQLSDILFDGHLFCSGQQLDYEIVQALWKLGHEALFGDMSPLWGLSWLT